MSRRLEHLDILKGISILLIVAFHVRNDVFNAQPQWFAKFSYQGVHAFFLASGLGLTYSMIHRDKFTVSAEFFSSWFKRRCMRILPLYWLVLFLVVILYKFQLIPLRVFHGTGSLFFDFILHLFMIHIFVRDAFYSIDIAWWFVAVIFYFYLIYPIIFILFYKSKKKILVFTFLLSLALIAYYLSPKPRQITASMVFFIIGIYLAFCIDRIRDMKIFQPPYSLYVSIGMFFCISVFATIVMVNALLQTMPAFSLPYSFNYLLFSLFSVSTIYSFSLVLVFFNKFLPLEYLKKIMVLLGAYSYALYLIHWDVIYPVFIQFRNPDIGVICYCIVLIVTGFILTRTDNIVHSFFLRRA